MCPWSSEENEKFLVRIKEKGENAGGLPCSDYTANFGESEADWRETRQQGRD